MRRRLEWWRRSVHETAALILLAVLIALSVAAVTAGISIAFVRIAGIEAHLALPSR